MMEKIPIMSITTNIFFPLKCGSATLGFAFGTESKTQSGLNQNSAYCPDIYTVVCKLGGVKSACKDTSFAQSLVIFAN